MFILVFFLASNLKNVIIRLGVETLELVTLAAFTTQMSLFTTIVTTLFVTFWAITSHMSRTIAVTTKGRVVSRTTISKTKLLLFNKYYLLITHKIKKCTLKGCRISIYCVCLTHIQHNKF